MPVYPANIPVGRVRGRYAFLWQDGMDADTQPDLSPVAGTVRLRCTAGQPMFYRSGSDPAIGLIVRDHLLTFNADGDLTDTDGSTFVDLLATNSPLITPTDFQWEATFELVVPASGERLSIPSFRFSVPTGADVDLVAVTPVSASNGTPIVQGPAGPTGPPATNPVASVTWNGTAWQYTSLAAATAAGINASQLIIFAGHPSGAAPSWARASDLVTRP